MTSAALYVAMQKQLYQEWRASGAYFTEQLNDALMQYKTELLAVVSLIETAEKEVTPSHFTNFIQGVTTAPGLSVYFAQYVPAVNKQVYEHHRSDDLGHRNFSIYPSGERAEYLPLVLAYPDKITFGYDILSSDYRHSQAVLLARNSLSLMLSEPTQSLFTKDADAIADTFVLRAPVYLSLEARAHKTTDSIGFYGLAGAYFTVEDVLKQVSPRVDPSLLYRLVDVTSATTPIVFKDSASTDTQLWSDGPYDTHYMTVAGRKWRVDTRSAVNLYRQIAWFWVLLPSFAFGVLAVCLFAYTRQLSLNSRMMLDALNKRIQVDELTGLLSRYQIQQELNECLAYCQQEGQKLAAMILDLDHFKTINDAFGHEVGDALLVKVSRRLTSVLPNNTVTGYLGGDAFLVLLVQTDHEAMPELASVAKDVIYKISQSYYVDGLTLDIGCSIGVAVYPEFGLDAVTLIKNADMAVYQAKTAGRATYHFYDGEMGRRFARNVRIETRLRRAIQEESLELHFQPKVDLITERCVGMEALLRWTDDELGEVSPAEFVPIAEQTGIILPLGDWVFEQAFKHIIEWQEQGITVPPMAINCSAAQLKRVDFLSNLLVLLDRYQVDPSGLEIEVTESILIEDAEGSAQLLGQLSRLGIKLALDDFGTGYSSLSYLKDLPFDYVKIDQVFIRDIIETGSNAALTKAIISLSHSLGLKVIAEGISHVDQLALLREYGCDIGQGYLFSKALGAHSMVNDPMIATLNEQDGLDG
ncbi:EAL domain-containing protein [Marinomonas sp. IMCC 4694]|uniref:bifunctional diguanylate cyclase/phosphodiesterase n=1 Tax=Marinomonas sp. IMCC 4694 TaxID=2605432 RepID=UPI001CA32D57|nr:EAL domain-containing protein [Marinomonas sp. IMCC 4694]